MRITAADELVVTIPGSRAGGLHRLLVDYGDDVVTITVYLSDAGPPVGPGPVELTVSLPGPLGPRAVRDGARALFSEGSRLPESE